MSSFILFLTTSCEKDLEVFSQDKSWINWFFNYEEDGYIFNEETTKTNYSFVYEGSGVETDTLWYEVQTTGFISDHDRSLVLQQVQDQTSGVTNAVAGVHFVAFDDAQLQKYYVAPAGTSRFKVPVVLLRDASLKKSNVVLKVTFAANNEFEVGYRDFAVRTITISDCLTMPENWNNSMFKYYFGAYGPVKHQFMIDVTKERWDDDYITQLVNGDSGYISYLVQSLRRKLATHNEERASQGLAPLAEEDGTLVTF